MVPSTFILPTDDALTSTQYRNISSLRMRTIVTNDAIIKETDFRLQEDDCHAESNIKFLVAALC